MNIKCLASSSFGNCYLIEFKSASILIEAGLSIKEIKSKLFTDCKKSLNDIDAVLITHDHKDHSKAVNDLKKLDKRVYGNKYVADAKYCLESLKMTCIAKDTFVFPFSVEHDAEDSLGFIIKSGDELLLFINDCKYIKYDLSNYNFDVIMIECNYSSKLIPILIDKANKENDKIMKFRYKRLLDSHMSSAACLKLLKSLNLKELMEEKPLTLEEKAKMYDELVSAGEALIKNGINPPFAVYLKGKEEPLIHRFTRHVEMEKARVIIGPEAIKVLDLNKNNNEVIVTVYNNRVVITKK